MDSTDFIILGVITAVVGFLQTIITSWLNRPKTAAEAKAITTKAESDAELREVEGIERLKNTVSELAIGYISTLRKIETMQEQANKDRLAWEGSLNQHRTELAKVQVELDTEKKARQALQENYDSLARRHHALHELLNEEQRCREQLEKDLKEQESGRLERDQRITDLSTQLDRANQRIYVLETERAERHALPPFPSEGENKEPNVNLEGEPKDA